MRDMPLPISVQESFTRSRVNLRPARLHFLTHHSAPIAATSLVTTVALMEKYLPCTSRGSQSSTLPQPRLISFELIA